MLVLANPGHGLEKMQASAAMYLGMQLLLPGEWAPSHKHTPTPVRNQKTLCQPRCTANQPPTMGAMAGATPKKMVTWLITCCAWAGGNMSRMTARDTTMPAPADRPCSARNSTSAPMLSDSAQPAEARVNTARPHSTTGRRPRLSDSAPWNSAMKAKANR